MPNSPGQNQETVPETSEAASYCVNHTVGQTGLEIIAEREARQLIMVQGSRISASVCLYVCLYICACVMLRNARSTSFSVRAYILMKWTSSLQYQDMSFFGK